MKILSWDVGIYNLSYCILEKNEETKEIKIIDWDIVNLVDNEEMKKNANLIFENIPRKLHEKPQLLDVDIVVIENQPSLKNPKMKSIQMILYSYFLILGKVIGNGDKSNSYIQSIDFCSASNKLKVYDGPEIVLEEKIKKVSKTKAKKDLLENKIKDEHKDEHKVDDDNKEEIKIQDSDKEVKNKKGSSVKYADKKRLAIEHSKYYLKENPDFINFFNEHKKKDDLADSFLQGLYYIKKNLKK
jgi:hypothetical protein